MSFISDMRIHFDAQELYPIDLSGLNFPENWTTIYVGPLTIHQAEQIDRETTEWKRIARHFQVRAKYSDGTHLVKPDQFDDLFKLNAKAIGSAVVKMQEADIAAEDLEKKS